MQNLPDETASCALHILLETLPLEAHLDTQVLSLFARLLHLPDSFEQEILCRQLSMKDIDSASWTQKVRTLLKKYSLPSAYDMLASPPKKKQWKQQVKRCITLYWRSKIVQESSSKKPLSHLNAEAYNPGTLHPVWDTAKRNAHQVVKAQVKARILVGRYILGTDKAKFKGTDPTCNHPEEDLKHFLIRCPALLENRKGHVQNLKLAMADQLGLEETELLLNNTQTLIQLIVDPSKLLSSKTNSAEITRAVEPITRNLYAMRST